MDVFLTAYLVQEMLPKITLFFPPYFNGLTPAQVAGIEYSEKERLFWLLVA